MNWILYTGDRLGAFTVNSKVNAGKYPVRHSIPIRIEAGDEWIAEMRGFTVLGEYDLTPSTRRIPRSNRGYLPKWESAFLEGLASVSPDPARVVEIGTGYGTSLVRILYGLHLHEDVLVWSIDIKECDEAIKHLNGTGIPSWRYRLIVSDSVVAAGNHDGFVDMEYIDGSHSYSGVMADIGAWKPYLKVGGVMVFDDYADPLHEVTPAVDDIMFSDDDFELIAQVGTLIAFERVK